MKTSSRLRRSATQFALVVGFCVLGVSNASAQAETLAVTAINGGGGDRTDQADIRGINALDCSEGATILVDSLGSTAITQNRNVDIWVGAGDCNTDVARTGDTPTCFSAGLSEVDQTDGTFELDLDAINTADPTFCTGDEKTEVIFAFYTGEEGFLGPVENFGMLSITVDTQGPEAPAISPDNADQRGNTQVTLTWEEVNDQEATYRVFEGGDCGVTPDESTLMQVGGDTNRGADSETVNPMAVGLAVGDQRAFFVRAVDNLRNEGPLSNEICVQRIETIGFCGVFSAAEGNDGGISSGPCSSSGSGCSVRAPGSGRSYAALFFLMLGLHWKRR